MALNTFKCNCLTQLHFKGLKCVFNSRPSYNRRFYNTILTTMNEFYGRRMSNL